MDLIAVVTAIFTALSALAACMACIFNWVSVQKQIESTNINHCNERYSNIFKNIEISLLQKKHDMFVSSCKELFDLQGHEYLLWNDNRIPDKIYKYWLSSNARRFKDIKFIDADANINQTLQDVWKEAKTAHGISFNSYFVTCMEKVFENKINLIKKHKDYFEK